MYIAVPEDDDGVWYDDPVAESTKSDVVRLAQSRWPTLPKGYQIMVYRCLYVDALPGACTPAETAAAIADAHAL